MSIQALVKSAGHTISRNAPSLLTATATVGVVTTAVLSGKAALRADAILREHEQLHEIALTGEEKFRLVWKEFIPPVAMVCATIGAVIGANTVSSRRAAALMSAYSLTEKAFSDYKDKVVEHLGASKDRAVVDKVAERIASEGPGEAKIILTGNGEVLFYESITGRYFMASLDKIRKAENEANYQAIHEMTVSQNEFFRLINLPTTPIGDEFGWDLTRKLELQISTMTSEDERPCFVIGYRHWPSAL